MAFDVDDYARGNNRVASAESYYEGALDATLTGTYANDFEGTLRFDFTDGSVLEISSEYTDGLPALLWIPTRLSTGHFRR